MSGQPAALAPKKDRPAFVNLSAAPLRDLTVPGVRRPSSPLDFCLSWMSPVFPVFPSAEKQFLSPPFSKSRIILGEQNLASPKSVSPHRTQHPLRRKARVAGTNKAKANQIETPRKRGLTKLRPKCGFGGLRRKAWTGMSSKAPRWKARANEGWCNHQRMLGISKRAFAPRIRSLAPRMDSEWRKDGLLGDSLLYSERKAL